MERAHVSTGLCKYVAGEENSVVDENNGRESANLEVIFDDEID